MVPQVWPSNMPISSVAAVPAGDKWQMDEVFLTIKGERHYLWRAVDQDGNVLDILVQRRRDKQAAKKFFRKLLKGLTYVPRVIVTDKLKSYGPPSARFFQGWNIVSTGISTTGRRIRINRPVSGSGACNGSSPPATPNGSSPPMALSLNISVRAGIGLPRLPTVKKWRTDSRSGRKSRPRPWLPEGKREVRSSLSCPGIASVQIS